MLPFKPPAIQGGDLQTIPSQDVPRLLGLVLDMRGAADSFLSFSDAERESGVSLGFEMLAAELAFVSRDEHMDRLQGALTRASRKNQSAALSEDGFSKVRRLEALLGEVRGDLDRRLGQELPPQRGPQGQWGSAIVVGIVALGIWMATRR